MPILAPVSAGELIDKITILRIKVARIGDADKARNAQVELDYLAETMAREIAASAELDALTAELTAVNGQLWDIEDGKRACERAGTFDDHFIQLARSVYIENDRRARIKRDINRLTGSEIVEEKSYKPY